MNGQQYGGFNEADYEEMTSDDAAATAFGSCFVSLLQSEGKPEDVTESVDELLDELSNCAINSFATLDEMISYVFDSARVDRGTHYIASNFLAEVTEKYTREVQGRTFAQAVIGKLREVNEYCTMTMNDFSQGNQSSQNIGEVRLIAAFYADLCPKLLVLSSFKAATPAVIYGLFEIITAFVHRDGSTIPQAEILENVQCATLMLKLAGPSIDRAMREDSSIAEKIPGVVAKLYDTLRELLITANDLNKRCRRDIIKVLEYRASRWGEVPSPDHVIPTGPEAEETAGQDEVDPALGTHYGPDQAPLTQEELDFMNDEANAINNGRASSDEEPEVDEYGEDNVENLMGGMNLGGGDGQDVNGGAAVRTWSGYEAVPDEVLAEFRRRQKPDYQPNGGDADRHYYQ